MAEPDPDGCVEIEDLLEHERGMTNVFFDRKDDAGVHDYILAGGDAKSACSSFCRFSGGTVGSSPTMGSSALAVSELPKQEFVF